MRAWVLLFGTLGTILSLCTCRPVCAQTTSVSSKLSPVTVPFIGCRSSGQIRILDAPTGTNRSVPISRRDALALAYYGSADGISVLAPRGWYCEGVSGSSGYALFLSPTPIDLSSNRWFTGPAIEVNHLTGDNSGRYEVAEIIARVFPDYRALAIRNTESIDLTLPTGPYAKDVLKYKSRRVVEYTTPAQTEGLGTHSWLRKNNSPIAGAAILTGDPPDLVLLSVRLPPGLTRLALVIARNLELEAVDPPRN
jgi:hypothetical protein